MKYVFAILLLAMCSCAERSVNDFAVAPTAPLSILNIRCHGRIYNCWVKADLSCQMEHKRVHSLHWYNDKLYNDDGRFNTWVICK
jgi:hypothetical protein